MKIYVKISGGLCNNLFRIATAYSYSLKYNFNLICDVSERKTTHSNFINYYDNFFKKLILTDHIQYDQIFQQPDFGYCDIPKFNMDFMISGYFQSEKFFKIHQKEILSLFEIDEKSQNIIFEKYNSSLDQDTCSLHVRRGDYQSVQHILPILPISYYVDAVEKIGKDKLYFIFSDDINWCKNNFDFIPNKIFIENNTDIIDLYLMSKCKNNIIANSTFSWWGAWLNTNINKQIISPNIWFGPFGPQETEDIIPSSWHKI